MIKLLKSGDIIVAMGISVVVKEIIYQDYFNGKWDVEFVDSEGKYRHWKQEFDGGDVVR